MAAITTSTHPHTIQGGEPPPKTVARSMASLFEECLGKIRDPKMDERGEYFGSLSFVFMLCLNAMSHPCFAPLSYLNLRDRKACIKALLEVGKQLVTMVHPSTFRFKVQVSSIIAKPTGMAEENAITVYSLYIDCFGKQHGSSTPKVEGQDDLVYADHIEVYNRYQKTSDRMWILNLNRYSLDNEALFYPSIASTVAQSISMLFQNCLASIPKERFQEEAKDPLSFQFNICDNGSSHPCFDPCYEKDQIAFLRKVGNILTSLIKPSNYRYEIKVESNIAQPITFYSLTIEHYAGTTSNEPPRIYESYGTNYDRDETLSKLCRENCNKIWILQKGHDPQFI